MLWIWVAAQVAAVAAIVAVSVHRRRRTSGLPRRPRPEPLGPEDARVTFPRDGETRELRALHKAGGYYLIVDFPDRATALRYLRGCEVRRELVYVIAENPEGNLGKDLIMIFEETDGSFVELAERSDGSRSTMRDCGRCGYQVLPVHARTAGIAEVSYGSSVRRYYALDGLQMGGHGFRCGSCKTLTCAWCLLASGPTKLADSSLVLRCLHCRSELEADPF
ncbi:hypothetical protein O1R50_05100 [Glycomyces luteolus]|uniref:Uncharacterized protein n=1 Tax=Glycomyces luteolus TaxID=2670330 RepID=A0A9X3P658_9ACTN|nr:hypothetical protein [Glycomyces luteolus]MDA1358987.1 hypothetical protein [Glycomyces luteolus]